MPEEESIQGISPLPLIFFSIAPAPTSDPGSWALALPLAFVPLAQD